ncbi:hypothetical protein JYU34_000557 [Plutella xylostella]|uniref:Paramyosin n=2 Tax=Plutella xylostella TaxID=51655 RepID=A0ABQ7R814_PLUXY|nr:uncharacterized protein LOC105381606 [Plutella xylostella]KAG7313432.1 hypothetical protein JYU34_000557 [Plutella xylostella]
MSRVGRVRRTRVYDCNYNKGESYYRPVLDRLDGKSTVTSSRAESERNLKTDVDSRIRSALEETEAAQDELFDSRGNRASRGKPLSAAFEDEDLGDEVTQSLKRLRAGKKSSRFAEDIDFENTVSNLENRMRISDKILESVGINSEMSSARRALADNEERTEKRIARRLNDEGNLTKWTALKSDDESNAVQRAKATRARLTDLEDEMTELSERSAAREKRAARLRALVAENEAEESSSNVTSTKVTFRAEREKKQVTF